MFNIINKVFEDELKYKGTTVLKYKIEYPYIVSEKYNYGIENFNKYNYLYAINSKKYAENVLFPDAKKLYDYSVANNYPIMVYELYLVYDITYNNDNIISLYNDKYIFTGGAHGSTVRTSQNWNINYGRQFSLGDLFNYNCYYVLYILKQINLQIAEQIKSGSNQYFDNYCELVIDTLRLNQFYLTNDNIVIYFQQYDIAPYSSGIPTFNIKGRYK